MALLSHTRHFAICAARYGLVTSLKTDLLNLSDTGARRYIHQVAHTFCVPWYWHSTRSAQYS